MRTSKKKSVLAFVAWMQLIGCILVILGHSYPFVTPIPVWAKQLQIFIYDFHMPLFVWCSGYLFSATNQTERYTFWEFCIRRSKRILVPYLAFSLIGLAPKVVFASFLNDSAMSFSVSAFMRALLVPRENIWGHFWFLPVIMVLGIIGRGITRMIPTRLSSTIVLITLAMVHICPINITGWFGINDVLDYMFYFVAGMYCSRIRVMEDRNKLNLCAAGLIAGGIVLFLLFPHIIIVRFCISLVMIAGLWMFTLALAQKLQVNSRAVWGQTYPVFILSWPCQLVVEILMERIYNLGFYLTFPCQFAVGLLMPLVILQVIDCFEAKIGIHAMSFILGKNYD